MYSNQTSLRRKGSHQVQGVLILVPSCTCVSQSLDGVLCLFILAPVLALQVKNQALGRVFRVMCST